MSLFRQVLQDWKKLLIFLIVPGCVPLLLCWLFSQVFVENIPFGIANLDNSMFSRQVVQSFENHPGLDVVYYANSESELEEAITDKKVAGGLIIPRDYGEELAAQETPRMLLIFDASNLLIANNAQGYSSAILAAYNARCQVSMFEGQDVIPQTAGQTVASFSFVERILYDPQLSYMTYLVYIIVPLVIQFFYLNNYLLPLIMKEKNLVLSGPISLSLESKRLGPLAVRVFSMWTSICISSSLGMSLAGRLFGLPVRGNLLEYFVLMMAFLLAITVMGLVLSSFLTENIFSYFVEFYLIINMLFIITSGAIWPEYMFPAGFAAVVKSIWPYILIANPLKFLCLKGIGWNLLWPCLFSLLRFTAVWLVIAAIIYALRIWRRRRAYISISE